MYVLVIVIHCWLPYLINLAVSCFKAAHMQFKVVGKLSVTTMGWSPIPEKSVSTVSNQTDDFTWVWLSDLCIVTLCILSVDWMIYWFVSGCLNFLKLCKIKYYNFCLFHSVQVSQSPLITDLAHIVLFVLLKCNTYIIINYTNVVMDDSRIRNRKWRFFPRIKKKSKFRCHNKLVHRFLLTWNTFIFDRDNVAIFW